MGRIRSSLAECHLRDDSPDPVAVAALENWGRWVARRGGGAAVSSSIWRAALRGARWDGSHVGAVQSVVDDSQATKVEKTICGRSFSPHYRALLVNHYALGHPPQRVCARLTIPGARWADELVKAVELFRQEYERLHGDLEVR